MSLLFSGWKKNGNGGAGMRTGFETEAGIRTSASSHTFDEEMWFMDLQKLSNDELMRMYSVLKDGRYSFAKNAWYVPIENNHRCPIMVAKGYQSPNTPEKMVEFEGTAKMLEQDYRHFIDAWDFGYITEKDIEKAILVVLELRNIEITERIRL